MYYNYFTKFYVNSKKLQHIYMYTNINIFVLLMLLNFEQTSYKFIKCNAPSSSYSTSHAFASKFWGFFISKNHAY